MIDVYSMIVNQAHSKSSGSGELHAIYSIDIEVEDGNWDYYSGVYFILKNDLTHCQTSSLRSQWFAFSIKWKK